MLPVQGIFLFFINLEYFITKYEIFNRSNRAHTIIEINLKQIIKLGEVKNVKES
jgi:hypothetical protein